MNKVYAIVTERMLKLMDETKSVPWVKPWAGGARIGDGQNIVSGHKYRGINALLTYASGFSNPYFLSFNQAKEVGASVRKGSTGIPIVYWGRVENQDADGETDARMFCRYYTVFNVDQIEGLPERLLNKVNEFKGSAETKGLPRIDLADQTVTALKADIRFGEQRAYYSPTLDYINMPNPETFTATAEFYSTMFHELAHWTGHASRLNRKELAEPSYFGSHNYSREELVAELTACFVLNYLNIQTGTAERNSAAYLNNWHRRLSSNPDDLIIAAQRAQKAADYILKLETQPKQKE